MPTDRGGPALTVVGSCEGCSYAIRQGPPMDGEWIFSCKHPSAKYGIESAWTGSTPTWCPLLPAARVALGRELAKEGES